jgi:hypothetical protein
MTALQEYQRLEAFGIWHASPKEQRRDVIVSLGEATLTISDSRMSALSHWSLPAIERLNPGQTPACFGPGPEMPEVLELDDEAMIAAIEKVRSAVGRRRQPPARLRHLLTGSVVMLLTAAFVVWLPGALVRQTVKVVPAAKRAEIGEALLDDIRRVAGSPCETALGRRALDRLRARLLPEKRGRVVVLSGGVQMSEHLPGGLILLNRALVEDYEDPAVAAGHILAEDQAATDLDPLGRLLREAGVFSTIRLLATGNLSSAALDAHAEALTAAPSPRPADAALIDRFAAADTPSTPYAYSLDITGEATLALIEADPVAIGAGRPLLADGDWISLQSICGE